MSRIQTNSGIMITGGIRVTGNMNNTQNSNNTTTTTYGGSNYSYSTNSGNTNITKNISGNTTSTVTNNNISNSNNSNSGNTNSSFNTTTNSNNTNSGNVNSGNQTTITITTNSNNRVIPSQYQVDVPLTEMDDMEDILTQRGFKLKPERKKTIKESLIRDKSYLLPPTFLTTAQERSTAVCYIEVDGSVGTGFMVSDLLLMTARHVLPNKAAASSAFIVFGYDNPVANNNVREAYRKSVWKLDPDTLFIEDEGMDVALVAVRASDQKVPSTPIAMERDPTIIKGNDSFNIIQHPSGGPKKFALRGWKLKEAKNGCIQYNTDTMPGSSGSPVFNDFWQLVAVHHSSDKDDSKNEVNQGTYINGIIDWIVDTTATFTAYPKQLIDQLKLTRGEKKEEKKD